MIPNPKNRDLNSHDGFAFMSVVRKHLRLMALIMCVALVIGIILSACRRPVYYSRSLVRLEGSMGTAQTDDAHRGVVMRELVQAHILERTAARLGIKTDDNDLRRTCLSKIAVHATSERDLEVDVWAYSKEWAENWTQALVHEYLEFRRGKHDSKSGESIKGLRTDTLEIIGRSELSIGNLPLEIAQLNQRIDAMGRVRVNLQDPNLDVIARLSLLSSLDKPVNLNISGVAAGLDQDLERKLQGALERFDVEYQNLLDQKAVREARLPEYNEFRRNNGRPLQNEILHESGELARNIADPKLSRATDRVDRGERPPGSDLTYMGIQQLDDGAVWPRRVKYVLFFLFGGSLLAVGVPFLIEHRGRTITNLEQVKMNFQLRALGTVPNIGGHARDLPPRSECDHHIPSFLAESFDVIRANLVSTTPFPNVSQVTMVTSALPSEGKTLVSSNLAAAFARVGDRTLLIDSDLRRGRVHRLFGFRRSPGLTNVLLDEVPIEEAIRPTTCKDSFVLTAGRPIDSLPEILGSTQYAHLMVQLREKYDRIVIDTPPVLGLSETFALQRNVDGVLFVIWGGSTSLHPMKVAIEMLQNSGANLYGFVLNRFDRKSRALDHVRAHAVHISGD
jgi:capsular exopolysaccharide synthesis family protein